ncbi:sucrase-isomaltase, intestinal-like [Ruditapes philippinarum]|uniref:sucrase-isomaltase, intestinal-like n=1 Tax=Ruditapes philippinarum TaxID=129788 RepID=UPI00295C358B|nr:sucrase-isomaltase, intestinal-like [Ruditapes philippinarum]
MSDDKFYRFEESASPVVIGEEKPKSCSRERLCWILLVLLLIGAVIGVSVYFTGKDDTASDGKLDAQTGGKVTTGAPVVTVTTKGTAATTSKTTEKPDIQELYKRIDCIPEAHGGVVKATPELCTRRRCVYSDSGIAGIPVCYFKPGQGYRAARYENTNLGFRVNLEKKVDGPFGSDLDTAVFNVEMRGDNMIRFTFDDPVFNRYKVPLEVNLPEEKPKSAKYEIKITSNSTFAFQIIRKSTGRVLWDTGVGGLVLSDQFLQISTKLPSEDVYGFGENLHDTFRHNLSTTTTWPMFARDQPTSHWNQANLYGVHPFYTCMEDDGNSHGVFLLNSNAMEYSFNPLPMLTYRTIGGILDFYMFLGPEPENVVQQYTGLVGRPYMMPYWALGFQICRYGYKNTAEIEAVVNSTKEYNIPHDVQYADIDHFDANMDFTLDKTNFGDLPQYFTKLRENGMRTVIILDPAFISSKKGYEPYDNLTALRGSVMWPEELNVADEDMDSTRALLGYVSHVWPSGKSVFPDFFKKETQDLWSKLIVKHRNVVPFDGMWIDMNEPANFGTNLEKPWNWPDNVKPWSLHCPINNQYEDPPYRTKAGYGFDNATSGFEGRISDKTICMVSRQGDNGEYRHYDVHSLYGWSEAPPTLKGMREATGERSFVLSRSTYPGSGKYAGHWLGDNDADWSDLKKSIIGMLEFNLFGIPYVGADICGYFNDGSAELCKRWLQLGAFYPFSRNHNQKDAKDNHPTVYGPEVANAAREALETRYWLLPYLYTLFHKAHTEGSTVVRPLFHEFPENKFARSIYVYREFLWGKALLIAPITDPNQNELDVYMPGGAWYDFYDGHKQSSKLITRQVDSNSKIGLFVRGGFILPMQRPANNTAYSRKNPLKLLVALDDSGSAEGELFWDDGNSVDTYESGNYFFARFKAQRNSLTMEIDHDNTPDLTYLHFEEIQIYGVLVGVTRVYCDGKDLNYTSQDDMNVLTISNLTIPLTRTFTIYWSLETEDERERHDCMPESMGGVVKVTKESCEKRGCIYNGDASQGPTCYLNSVNYGYTIINTTSTEFGSIYHLKHKGRNNPFSNLGSPDIPDVLFTVEMRGNDVLRFKFEDATKKRYEVPIQMNLASTKGLLPRYKIKITGGDNFSFQVLRTSNGEVLWDTGIGGLTFSEQFLQISTKLPSKNIYGFGENVHDSLRHDLNNRMWPMWSRDQPAGGHLNHYGVHPFYMCVEGQENGGHSHGVFLLNSNAQDYSFNPLPMLTYRTIGGILDFYMFLGPEPENVVQQYTAAIGRPYMPAYWSLGFQLCRYGYNNITNLQDAVEKTKAARIPHDVQYADIDHMDERMDFTIDNKNFPGLNTYFKSLQKEGMHIIIILDPTLIINVPNYDPYTKMTSTNSNIKWPVGNVPAGSSNNNNDLLGYVWPSGKVVFPDFLKNSTKYVWQELIEKHHRNNLTFDGLWIDMNEPANFGTNEEKPWNWPANVKPWSLNCSLSGNTYEHPPYRTMAAFAYDHEGKETMISDKTVCMRALQGDGGKYKHYDVHSLYGWSQTEPTLDGLRKATGKRGIVISRSTFPSSGKHAGHWLGDNNSGWTDLRHSIIGSLEFNLFGIPYIGADICGFFSDTTPELCKRWMQLGAFYTFSRNHNGLGSKRQDPGSLGADVAEASRIAMETRYWLLPYLYTLFHKAHTEGHTVMRPLHHEFTDDEMTFDIDKQFLWGPSLMISPILYEGQTSISMYIPRGPWYDFYTGEEMDTQNGYVTLPVQPDSKIPLHVRAGHILPMQAPANNTHFSRKNPFTLLVALKDSENGGRGYTAKGDLFWDDGVSIDTYENKNYFYARFSSGHDTLSLTVEHDDPSSTINGLFIDTVKVYGVRSKPKFVYIGDTVHTQLNYDENTKVLEITNLMLHMNQDFMLEWRYFKMFPDKKSNINAVECSSRSCIYDGTHDLPYFVPKCYMNRTAHGYVREVTPVTVKDDFRLSLKMNKKLTNPTLFGNDKINLRVHIEKNSNNILHVKITDWDHERYEAPVELNLPHEKYNNQSLYDIQYSNERDEFFVKVIRKDTNTVIWDTSAGPLIFSEQYLQISSKLPSKNFYGLGEHRHFHLKHDLDYRTWPIFTRDAAVNSPDYSNLYGAHPFYMNLEDDKGNAHAVLLLNTNAMEVVLEPMPRVTYRTIGGILDFYIFLGQSPEEVIQQYTSVIGHPVMVPYWSLGFQLCRWGYDSLDNMKAAVDRTRAAQIPHDIQYADIDHMDERKDFTYDHVNFAGLPEYIKELQAGGMHFIIILDPALIANETDGYWPYDTGVSEDVFIKWPNNTGPMDSRPNNSDIMLGYVWPKGKVAFPDFLNNGTKDWWSKAITKFHDTLNFDGLWIDMNEPANFDTNGLHPWNWPEKDKPYWTLKCTLDNNTLDIPPYKPRSVTGDYLSEKTLCMVGKQGGGKYNHYDVHSLYGWSEMEPTLRGLRNATGERGVVVSRSTYPSGGKYGAHWLGDNDSFWRNLHDSIIGIIEFNLFGIPYTGADICGFFSEPSVEMCQRWMQLGAFYTFSRNHNGKGMKDQDPALFGEHVAYSSKIAYSIRYSLLPYLYTQFYRVHTEGGTIIRSMMHEFPGDKRTWDVDTQFMWASALLIAPVLEQGHIYKDVYLPDARWFHYYTGEEMSRNRTVTVDAPRDFIPLFLRGGYIVPTQDPANNTVHSRKNPMHLMVIPDDNMKAEGNLFWDDGVGIDTIDKGNYSYSNFKFTNNNLTYTVTKPHKIVGDLMFKYIWVYGVQNKPSNLSVSANMTYNSDTKLLMVSDLNYRLDTNFTFSWS